MDPIATTTYDVTRQTVESSLAGADRPIVAQIDHAIGTVKNSLRERAASETYLTEAGYSASDLRIAEQAARNFGAAEQALAALDAEIATLETAAAQGDLEPIPGERGAFRALNITSAEMGVALAEAANEDVRVARGMKPDVVHALYFKCCEVAATDPAAAAFCRAATRGIIPLVDGEIARLGAEIRRAKSPLGPALSELQARRARLSGLLGQARHDAKGLVASARRHPAGRDRQLIG
jgi:hypothetical protein